MADRYWTGAVNGGSGTWDASNTANWSASSGGAGGASVPTAADLVYFDASSGSGVCTLGADVVCVILSFAGYAGTIAFSTFKISIAGANTTILNMGSTATLTGLKRIELTAAATANTRTLQGDLASAPGGAEANVPDIHVIAGTDTIGGGVRCRNFDFTGFSGKLSGSSQIIYGDLTLSALMTTISSSPIVFSSTSATPRTITSNGVQFNFELRFDGIGGTWVLQDDLRIVATSYLRTNNGTFLANNKNITIGAYVAGGVTAKTLDMGSGTWTVTGNDASFGFPTWWANFGITNLTVVPGTAVINMTSTGAKSFAGAGKTWPTLNQGGTGALTIQQSNTFANITNTAQPATITLTAGTTQTVGAFGVSGTAGNLITLNTSSAGTRATLIDTGGTNEVSFVSIKDINATGGAVWSAYLKEGNIDAGNNLGWDFFPGVRQIFRQVFSSIFRPIF
jgi:hypothetical protein